MSLSESGILRGWAAATDELLSHAAPPAFLVVTMGTAYSADGHQLRRLDELARDQGVERPGAVAAVLLPPVVHRTAGSLDDKIDAGLRLFGRSRSRGIRFSGWKNTYFERLVGMWRAGDQKLHQIKENRLRSIVEKIGSWGKDVEAALYVHTDAPEDRLRTRGAPCLQYVQFRLYDHDKIELFALYRAHDYLNKALGNFIGLQRLGSFVASESGRKYERQTVFSVHPFVESGGVKRLRQLVHDVRAQPDF